MADKIVILEDSEGNNIYPISRGLATNSVDTNAIQNGAVTSAKIDSATYTGTNAITVGSTTSSLSATITRLANIVILNAEIRLTASTQSVSFSIVPTGCTPRSAVGGAAVAFVSGATIRYVARVNITAGGSGTVNLTAGTSSPNADCYQFTIVYPIS